MKSNRTFSRREFLKKSLEGFVFGSIPLFFSCDGNGPNGPNGPLPNKAPDTGIIAKFTDDGKVEYTFRGTDPDGTVNYISIKINSEDFQSVSNNSSKLVEIIKGNNIVKAIAYDNKNLTDPIPAEYSFDSPDESEGKSFIGEILTGKTGTYKSLEKNVFLSFGEKDSFYVDYLIRKNDGKDAVVNYIGYKKNLNQEISNQKILSSFRIPSLYLVRIPANEINSKLSSFISNGFN